MPTTQKLLGHSSISTTSIYADVDLTDQIKAVSKLKFTLGTDCFASMYCAASRNSQDDI